MRPRLAVFSKYFGYAVGGAERSVFELVREKEREGRQIHIFRVDGLRSFNAGHLRMELPSSWVVHRIRLPVDWVRFKYAAAMINRHAVAAQLVAAGGAELWSYGFQAPMALLDHKGDGTYLIRDEYGLGWDVNYYNGCRRILKAGYSALEMPWRKAWQRQMEACIASRKVMVNSLFLDRELRKAHSDVDVEVRLPYVDTETLAHRYASTPTDMPLGVVMAGDNRIKGADLFRKLAARFPSERFYLFDRNVERPLVEDNLSLLPWATDSALLYRRAKAVVVPSRWSESFPRMILEARALGIPVIGSNRGGIPDAIGDNERVVSNLEDVDEWACKLAPLL